MKKFMSNYKNLIISFLTTFFIMTCIFIVKKVTPFGKYSILTVDLFHQYYPMLTELIDRIVSKSNLVYSFKMSGGLPFFRNFFNYMSSPFNIILIIFGKKNILKCFTFLISLKASLSALSFSYFAQKKFQSKNILYVIISILYGLNSYYIAYHWNIMWTDGLIFLPLITLGIDYIFDKNKCLLYIFSLVTLIISNYYIGYMTCIFSIIYFVVRFIFSFKKENYKEYLKKLIIYIFSSLIVGLLSFFVILPIFYSISSISATSNSFFPTSMYYNYNVLDFIVNHLSVAPLTIFKNDISNAPNISCGIFCISLLMIFTFNNKIKGKTKFCYLVIFILIMIGFFIPQIDYIWHAFHTPNDLPYRFSFIYTFMICLISCYSLNYIKQVKPIVIYLSYILIMVMILFLMINGLTSMTLNTLLFNAICISIYFGLYLIIIYNPKTKKISLIVLFALICIEIFISLYNNFNFSSKIDYLETYNESIMPLIESYKKEYGFNRLENIDLVTLNDSSLFGYYGITTFSSMMYEKVANTFYDLGVAGNYINSVQYVKNTPIFDLIFNINYIISSNDSLSNYNVKETGNNVNLFKNNYKGNLFYLMDENIKNYYLINKDPISNQSNFVKYSTGIENIFKEKSLNKKKILKNSKYTLVKYDIKNEEDNELYFYPNDEIEFFIINDILYYNNSNEEIVHYLENMQLYSSTTDYSERYIVTFISDSIYIGYSNFNEEGLIVYNINNKKMQDAYKNITSNNVTIENFKENYIKANCIALKDGVMFTSIPYDSSWNVYVNNKKVDTYTIMNSMLAFDVKKGKNNIVLKYEPKYLKTGALISLSTFIILITLILLKKKKFHNN